MRIFTLLFIISLFSCKQKIEKQQIGEEFGSYIYGHTMGNISATDDIYVQLAKSIDENLIGTQLEKGIINVYPKVDGEAFFQDARTIVFRSADKWTYDETYAVTLDLDRIYDDIEIANTKTTFTVSVNPIRLDMTIYKTDYSTNSIVINGQIKSSEPTDNEVIESLLSANQSSNNDIHISWQHYSDRNHSFTIEKIKRGNNKSAVKLKWKDGEIDKTFNGEREIKILPKAEFTVISANVREGARAIDINFSDVVKSNQQLEGLLTIEGVDKGYKYDINGNSIVMYPPKGVDGQFTLKIDKTIKREDGKSLHKSTSLALSFKPTPPAVALSGKGVIVPNGAEVIFPFTAQNLNGVQVEVFKIYQSNVLQFLQYNKLNYQYNLQPVGRIIHQEHINLSSLSSDDNSNSMVRYALDLSKIIDLDPGAVYQVRIGFSMADIGNYPCAEEKQVASAVLAERDGFTSIMRDQYNSNYNYQDRDNPCKNSYYRSNRYIKRNVLASNFGIICKIDINNKATTTVTDLNNINPLSSVKLDYYDFQQQLIQTTVTDGGGMSIIGLERKPSFVIAKSKGEFGYLSLQDRDANSLSEYDVAGQRKSDGLDGYIYGERGVWRPGDTIFLDFMLEDKLGKLPTDHPVSIKLKDARGKVQYTRNTTQHVGRIYHFVIPTRSNAVTGNWKAIVKVGGKEYRKTIKVETVKPNRIKVDFDKESLNMADDTKINIGADWLHGSPASDLKAKVDMSLKSVSTVFDNYRSYTFDDPARKIESYPIQLFDGNLDQNGEQIISIKKNKSWQPAGKLKARLNTKVFEKSGSFSTDVYTVPVDFYKNYVGVKVPKNRWGSNYIDQKNYTPIELVIVDKKGRPLKGKKLNIGLYTARWNWWYDRQYSGRYQYSSANHLGAYKKESITTDANGKATYSPKLSGYGNYMIRVCDEDSGHCTGQMFYTGSYYSSSEDQEGPSQLIFKTDKDNYTKGESVKVEIPSTAESKIFVSVEDGTKVLQAFWLDGQADVTKLDIPTGDDINSNIYIHAHLVQPHNNGENDLPIRMYGVVPVSIINPQTTLKPEIDMKETLRPNENYTIGVSERNGKPMSYTLAVVDEGLLSLTRHKTPDPWSHFYSKQALGVKTWDVYDYVLSGYGGEIDQYISIGGDAGDIALDNAQEINRFVPVVSHIGLFSLKAGDQASHNLTMPNYVGAVRVMVVSREDDSYGKSEKTVTVKQPIMVQSTLPRVLGPNESLSLSANVWAMDDKIKTVSVSATASDNITFSNDNESLSFDRAGDKLASFNIKVGSETGVASVTTTATGHGESTFEKIDIKIRNPNPYTSEVQLKTLQPGESWIESYEVFGSKGTNEGILEVSNLPPVNFGKRLQYLIRYPYGCLEQTTSSVFPQLYLTDLADLNATQQLRTEQNIIAAINKLSFFQQSNGGFSYWQGSRDVSDWGTTYAGHFLIEARDKGYAVPSQILNDFVKYQTSAASKDQSSSKHQAYRLYSLARAGEPHIGAMNRLRNNKNLEETSAYLLAATYAMIGQAKAAKSLISNTKPTVKPYTEMGYTYGSHVRDMAAIAIAQNHMGQQSEALSMIEELSKYLGQDRWYSTHSTAFALLAVGQIYGMYKKDDLKFEYELSGKSESIITPKSIYQKNIDVMSDPSGAVSIKNTSANVQFAKVVLSGRRPPGESVPPTKKYISLDIKYTDIEGKILDPKTIKQGTDFYSIATIEHLGIKSYTIEEIALSQIFPSGWEIQNNRITNGQSLNSRLDHQDIRDDRVYSFFDLNRKEKQVVKTRLTATHAGRFYLPSVSAEAMYDNEISSTTEGVWVEVVR